MKQTKSNNVFYHLLFIFTLSVVVSFLFACAPSESTGQAGGKATSGTTTPSGSVTGDGDLPIINSVEPSSGAPGDVISIYGVNLTSSTITEVLIEKVPAFILSTSEDKIQVRVPVLGIANGNVNITVSVGEESTTLKNSFLYLGDNIDCGDLPRIDSISPQSGPNNATVTINGAGFSTNSTQVSMGGSLADVQVQNPGVLTLSVPNLDALVSDDTPLDVVLQNSNGCQDVAQQGFTYRKDKDGDGVFDNDEFANCGTDPNDPDTDSDGLDDGDECYDNPGDCDPIKPDSDGDGLPDGVEFAAHMTCTGNNDFDGDGFENKIGDECLADPASCDCDDNNADVYPGAPVPGSGGQPDTINGVDYDCRPDKVSCDEYGNDFGNMMSAQAKANHPCTAGFFGTSYGIALPLSSDASIGENFASIGFANEHSNILCAQVYIDYDQSNPSFWKDNATYQIETMRYPYYGGGSSLPPSGIERHYSYEMDSSDQLAGGGSSTPKNPGCGFMKYPGIPFGQLAITQKFSSDFDFDEEHAMNADGGSNVCDFFETPLNPTFPSANYIRVKKAAASGSLTRTLEGAMHVYEVGEIGTPPIPYYENPWVSNGLCLFGD